MHTITQIGIDGRKVRLLFPETTGSAVLAHLSRVIAALALEQLEKGGKIDDTTSMLPVQSFNEGTG